MAISSEDKVMLQMALRSTKGYAAFAKYYFDFAPTKHQFLMHQIDIPTMLVLGSIASGKTTGTSISMMGDHLALPAFRGLTTSITSAQANLQFEYLMPHLEENKRIKHLIKDVVKNPFPTISFMNGSVWTFRTIGFEARNIRGMEFDRINFDEAAFEPNPNTVPTLRGRLRGNRIAPKDGRPGVPRMGRMDLTSSPSDAPWFMEAWNKGDKHALEYRPGDYYSMRITIHDNPHITQRQIDLMMAEMSDEQIRVELMAQFPDYGASMFPLRFVSACEDTALNQEMEDALKPVDDTLTIVLPPVPGFDQQYHPRHGITLYQVPYKPGHRYIMAGDPGMGDLPNRNAGVVMCLDVTTYPYTLAYFHWVSGHGSYKPFLQSYRLCMDLYHPLLKGIDATGPSKAIDELGLEDLGIETDAINFGKDKDGMLNALSMLISSIGLRMPVIHGVHRQLVAYQRDDKNLNQDIVMTLAQLAFLCRMVDRPARPTNVYQREHLSHRLPPVGRGPNRRVSVRRRG